MKLHMELSVKSIWKRGGGKAVNEKDFTDMFIHSVSYM